jgi:hypothetical protein
MYVLIIAESILIRAYVNWLRTPKNTCLVQSTSQTGQLIVIDWALSIKINQNGSLDLKKIYFDNYSDSTLHCLCCAIQHLKNVLNLHSHNISIYL